jgi:hypothetical protein
MAILNIFEMAALLKLDPAELLNSMKDVQGLSGEMPDDGAAESGLAVVDFTAPPAPGPDAPPVMRRRFHWGRAFSMKIPVTKSSDDV